ncbi:2-oxo acid dehydrogenase subunit E2 [Streptomyces asoensis]|uniref:Dihydrolipoamide acetyltransferase component of pyruvate dehydrogenase complex n=2 Tax=Streptomyces asoensis TaxID=249586 RepID=A0A6M4X468_9ACTN|nr:2-oxo acid dehydrogenase subunit E2 [Streptomyces asoensis]
MTEASVREFKMPDVGEGLTEAEILKWYVQPGDTVTDGQVVCEVETAKAAVELPIPYDGVVRALHFPEGTTVDVGMSIIAVDVSGGAGDAPVAAPVAEVPAQAAVQPPAQAPAAPEKKPEAAQAEAPQAEAPQAAAPQAAAPQAEAAKPVGSGRQPVLVGYGVAASSTKRRPRKGPETAVSQVPDTIQAELNGHGGAPAVRERPLAKPPVRKLAKDLGVDLATVVPSGPDGIITREDVHAAVAPAAPATQAAPVAEPAPQVTQAPVTTPAAVPVPSYDTARETRVPVKGVRKATAAAMVGSAFTAPHVTEFVTIDVTRTLKLVEELKQDKDMQGLRVNPLLLIARALLVAVKRNPEINASWDEAAQEIVVKHYVNLGIAAATPRGLLVPNIKDAHAKTLPQLAESLGELVSTAREGRTSPAAMQGGTVTITNVGVFGVDTGTPILNPGESAILAIGAIKLQPWVHKGKVKPRQVTTLALSFDHRLVDGELGSKVLADVAAILEQPKKLITWG